MGWLSSAVHAGAGLARTATRIPGVSALAKSLPFVGTALAAYQVYSAVTSPSSSGPMPPPPGSGGDNSGPGLLPRGPGGALQAPWNDPSPTASQKPHALDDSYLKKSYRAPHGYIVGYDPHGRPFALEREWAKKNPYYDAHGRMKKFHPAHKPPVSVGDYHALKRSHHTIKKFDKIFKLVAVVKHNTDKHGHVKKHHGGKK